MQNEIFWNTTIDIDNKVEIKIDYNFREIFNP